MSQPAVSKALRRLRDAFDDPLFVRGPSGIVPTPRAHAIVRAARSHLRHLQEDLVKDERFDSATSTRPITLALSDIAEMAFLPSVLEHLRTLGCDHGQGYFFAKPLTSDRVPALLLSTSPWGVRADSTSLTNGHASPNGH